MRMWLINSKKLCRQHLLGEHLEMHMFKGTIERGKSMFGYLQNNLVILGMIKKRHDELVKEMINRGYNHKSQLNEFNEGKGGKVNIKNNIIELKRKCKDCKKLLK